MADEKKLQKPQRISMRIYKHPVRLDGTITEFALDGSSFVVQFDGPYPQTRFYPYSENMAIDKEVGEHRTPAPGSTIWEVLR